MQPERPSLTMPAELTRRARSVAAGDRSNWQIPEAVDAATVILVRDTPAGPEVFLQRRVNRMTFAPGMYVFPGGRVETSDPDLPWEGPSGQPFARPEAARPTASFRAVTAAGARETWEEAGTALAHGPAGPVVERPARADADFGEWLVERGFRVAGSSLLAWSHWVTPEVESRRFDTRFLVTRLPAGQGAVDRGRESDHSSWFRPAAAIAAAGAGEMPMLPPTVHALQELADFDSTAAILAEAAHRAPRPLLPRPVLVADELQWQLEDAYTGEQVAW